MKSAIFRTVGTLSMFVAAAMLPGCSRPARQHSTQDEQAALANSSAFRLYVTNEASGDLTVIDSATYEVIETVPLGKRPRGIHPSPDGQTIYVAVSGSPIAGPDVDESTLPPPDKSADGIAVFDVKQNKVVRTIHAGSDPENFDVSKDGTQIYVSNEDTAEVSIVDIAAGTVVKSVKVGEQPEGVKVTPDGKFVWVTSEETGTIAVLDPKAGKIVKTFKVGHRPRSVAFLADGSRAYINAENDGNVVIVDAVKTKDDRHDSAGQARRDQADGCPAFARRRSPLRQHRARPPGLRDRYSDKQSTVFGGSRSATLGYSTVSRRQNVVLGQWPIERRFSG
jgi:YVTN family beta-propeller protein